MVIFKNYVLCKGTNLKMPVSSRTSDSIETIDDEALGVRKDGENPKGWYVFLVFVVCIDGICVV